MGGWWRAGENLSSRWKEAAVPTRKPPTAKGPEGPFVHVV